MYSWPWPGYHCTHAIRVLREEVTTAKATRAYNRVYDEAVRQALTVLWETADLVCGKRLNVDPDVDRCHGSGTVTSIWIQSSRPRFCRVSATTIDRMPASARLHIDGQRKRSKGAGAAI